MGTDSEIHCNILNRERDLGKLSSKWDLSMKSLPSGLWNGWWKEYESQRGWMILGAQDPLNQPKLI